MITKTVNLYQFDELSPKAKERARDWWRESEAQDFGAHGDIYEPIETAAKILGIEFKTHAVPLHGGGTRYESDIYWTLHVQGAGASFNATYSYAKGSAKAIRAEFGTDKTLYAIADDLADIQKRYAYRVAAVISSDSRYHSTDVECEIDGARVITEREVSQADSDAMRDVFKRFARWMYETIDEDYNSRMEDDYVDDSIKANEYTFTVDGKRED